MFHRLPAELQAMIWTMAYDDSELVLRVEESNIPQPFRMSKESREEHLKWLEDNHSIVVFSAIEHTCRTAREVVTKRRNNGLVHLVCFSESVLDLLVSYKRLQKSP